MIHFSGRVSATDSYHSDSNMCAQNLLYPARNAAYCVFKATCKDCRALFKLTCKCLLMCPMRVCFCSLIYVCLPFISYISMSQKYVLTPKYANCPNPAGGKVFRASSLLLCIFKCLTLFNTNTIENLDIKCLSVNTRGLNKSIKRRSFFRWIHNQNVHFTFLQETHSSKLSADVWSAEWGGKVFFCHGTTNSKGVMILINPKLDCKVEKCISDMIISYMSQKVLIF